MNCKHTPHILLIIAALLALAACSPLPTPQATSPQRLILATTTSTENSGLLAHILPDFEAKFNAEVDVVAVGTGQAMKIASAGDADVILVHARAQEDNFVADGHGTARADVMYNDFVIIGPDSDPAGIRGLSDAAAAFARIAAAQAPFISRGDESGTHVKEKEVWAKADIEPAGDWYISAGQGMGAVLTMANEQLAYTLSDRGTYLARTAQGIELPILVEGDSILFNPYGVIPVNPDKHAGVNFELASRFVEWLTSLETQEMIAGFGVEQFGQPLFVPDSDAWRQAKGLGPR